MKNKRVLSFCVVIILFLLLPVILDFLGLHNSTENFQSIPSQDLGHPSPYIFIADEMSRTEEPVDILILGSSFGWTGLDASIIASGLSKEMGRKTTVLNFCSNWRGEDQYFIILRDLLLKRKVKMVLISQPVWEFQKQYSWHYRASYFMRFSDRYLLSGLSLNDKISWYSHLVLGAPRQLLSAIRPNIPLNPIPHSSTFGSMLKKRGFQGENFVYFKQSPIINKINRTYNYSITNSHFKIIDSKFPKFQTFWINHLSSLLTKNNISKALISIPTWSTRNDNYVKIYRELIDIYDSTYIGIPPYELFGKMGPDKQKLFFYNEHMNYNGAELFTESIVKTIVETYKKSLYRNE